MDPRESDSPYLITSMARYLHAGSKIRESWQSGVERVREAHDPFPVGRPWLEPESGPPHLLRSPPQVRMFKVLHDFRKLVEAVQDLVAVLGELLLIQREAGPALDRLAALELSRHQFEAEVAGTLLKAEGKLKAANNSEARERQLRKAYDRDTDPLPEGGEEVAEAGSAVLALDVASREAERVPAMRLGLAADPKAAAVSAKWSR